MRCHGYWISCRANVRRGRPPRRPGGHSKVTPPRLSTITFSTKEIVVRVHAAYAGRRCRCTRRGADGRHAICPVRMRIVAGDLTGWASTLSVRHWLRTPAAGAHASTARSSVEGMAGRVPEGCAVSGGESAGVGETPPRGDGGDGVVRRGGGEQVTMRAVHPGFSQVGHRGGAEVTPIGAICEWTLIRKVTSSNRAGLSLRMTRRSRWLSPGDPSVRHHWRARP